MTKLRVKVIIGIIIMGTLIASLSIKLLPSQDEPFNDKLQRSFVREYGFLQLECKPRQPLEYYIKAIRILRDHGIWDKSLDYEKILLERPITIDKLAEIENLLFKGARCQLLLVRSYEKKEHYFYDEETGATVSTRELLVLSQVALEVGEKGIASGAQKHALTTACALIATGSQLTWYRDLVFRNLGICIKQRGLKLLEEYVMQSEDVGVKDSLEQLKNEFKAEREAFRESTKRHK